MSIMCYNLDVNLSLQLDQLCSIANIWNGWPSDINYHRNWLLRWPKHC